MQVDFYALGDTPIDRVLPRIAERLLADGARLLIVAGDDAALARLDRQLWDYVPESFLPHGREGGNGDTRQPVLLSQSMIAANGARNVALADGVWRDAALHFDRAFYLFGTEHLGDARGHWRALGGKADVERRFWKQDADGKWMQGP